MAFGDIATTTNSATATPPTGLSNGHLALAAWCCDFGGISFGSPTGWTLLLGPSSLTFDGQSFALYGCIYDSTQSFVWSPSSGGDLVCQIAYWTGRVTTSLAAALSFSTQTTPDNNGNNSPVLVNLTSGTAASGDDVAAFGILDAGNGSGGWSFTPPIIDGGLADERADTSFNWSNMSCATKDNVSGGALGTLTFTATNVGQQAGFSGFVVSMISAGGAPATPDIPVPMPPTCFFGML